jgi:hypothetical protein
LCSSVAGVTWSNKSKKYFFIVKMFNCFSKYTLFFLI